MLYSYFYKALRTHENDDNYFCYLFSLEMSATMVLGKVISTYLYEEFNVRLSINDIFSRKKDYTLSDENYNLVLKGIEWIKKMESKFIIFDKSLNAEILYTLLLKELEKRGSFQETENRKIYIPNNPNLLFNVIIDHISLVMPSRGRDLKREIDLITAYLVTLRNMTKLSPIIVQQVNREQSTMERRKQGLYEVRQSDAADSADPTKAAEVVIAVFSPKKEKLNNYVGYDVSVLDDKLRAIQLLKGRYGIADVAISCCFWGDINYWRELPKAEHIQDYTNYLEPNFIPEPIETESIKIDINNFTL